MMTADTLFTPDGRVEPHAVARRTDPATSHAAAASVQAIRKTQLQVLWLFSQCGPMTDEQLLDEAGMRGIIQSPSGLRSRRCELFRKGKVVNTGEKRAISTGRQAIVWGLA